MTGKVTLQCPQVNGGTEVELYNTVVTKGWKNLTNSTPVPGKFDIVETDVAGFENPKINLTGVIDVGDIPSNFLTESLLMDFAQVQFDGTSSTAIKLTVSSGADGSTDVYLKGRPSAGYSVGGTYRDFIYIIIEDWSITFDSQVTDERRWNFNINCTETKLRNE